MPLTFSFKEIGNVNVFFNRATPLKNDGQYHEFSPLTHHFSLVESGDPMILSMSEEDALCLSFAASHLRSYFAIKILLDGINAITGESESAANRLTLKNNDSKTQTGQNYLLAPEQHQLDRFKTVDGTVRQLKKDGTTTGRITLLVVPIRPEYKRGETEYAKSDTTNKRITTGLYTGAVTAAPPLPFVPPESSFDEPTKASTVPLSCFD